MAYVERRISVEAPPHHVWAVMSDVERWPEWTSSIRSVHALDGSELVVGRRYRVDARGTPPATWRVERVDEGRGFVWATASGLRIIAGHAIEPAGGGSTVTLSIRTEGVLGLLFGWPIARLSRRNMDLEADGLKRRSEERARERERRAAGAPPAGPSVSVSQMTTFRLLQGLPAYGPVATGFPEEWARLGREGLVVEFAGTGGTTWVGNFRPGIGGLDAVRWHPNGTQVLVASAGALWCVDPGSRAAERIAPAVLNIWELESGDLLIDDQGLAFFRLGRLGVVWHTQRISWDGFQNVRLEAKQIAGEAWSPIEDRWLPFSVDLETGRAHGGSYTGP